MIPTKLRVEIQHGEDAEDDQRDDLLHDLELDRRELSRPPTVCRNLEAVLDERNQPIHQDHDHQRRLLELQMPVPSQCHEDVGDDEEENREHVEVVSC